MRVEPRPDSALRCAFCHDDLEEEAAFCPGCQTVLHLDCRAQLTECPTLGCRSSMFTPLPAAARPRRDHARPSFRIALARLAREHRPASPARRTPSASPRHGASPDDFCAQCFRGVGQDRWVCAGCGVVLHQGCRSLFATCPTIGCDCQWGSVPALAPSTSDGVVGAPLEAVPERSREDFERALRTLIDRSRQVVLERRAKSDGNGCSALLGLLVVVTQCMGAISLLAIWAVSALRAGAR